VGVGVGDGAGVGAEVRLGVGPTGVPTDGVPSLATAADDGEEDGRAPDSPNPSWPPDIGTAMAIASSVRTTNSGRRLMAGDSARRTPERPHDARRRG
jgi:hypothetical protein